MKVRLRELIETLDYNELLRMKDDLTKGGEAIRILVDNKIKDEQKKHDTFCTICANRVDAEGQRSYTLLFGPQESQRKATFCAMDCLEYFIAQLKKMEASIK